jgi:hypothetical protein
MTGSGQCIVQNIAAGAGDDQQLVVRSDLQRATIDGRILPTGVVDQ